MTRGTKNARKKQAGFNFEIARRVLPKKERAGEKRENIVKHTPISSKLF